MATSKGLLARSRDHFRPFHLSRSFFAGTQRHYAAVWTADCRCDWEHFKLTVHQMLSTSIVGLSLLGSDVPGFYRDPCDDQIVVRWYQMGCMMPFFRAHAHRLTNKREPWTFSEEIREKIKNTIVLRYQFLHYM
jgi:alpha-glucosidase (family GH31 glycosyl hydrolase)